MGNASATTAHGGYLCITFDDGTQGEYDNAFGTLSSYGIPATVYMPSDFVGMDGRLTASELIEMQDAGWEIGSHGKTHTDFTNQSAETYTAEMADSKAALTALGLNVVSLAYPFGGNNAAIRATAATYYERMRTANDYEIYQNHFTSSVRNVGVVFPTTITDVNAELDRAIATNSSICFIYHQVLAGGVIDGTSYTVTQLSDAVIAKETANGLQALRFRDLSSIGTTDICEWVATADGVFSNAANWADGVVPTTGKNILLSYRSNKNITFDTAITLGDIYGTIDYTGSLIQGSVALHYRSMNMAGGVYTPSSTAAYTNICDNQLRHRGTIGNNGYLTINGVGVDLNSGATWTSLTVNGAIRLQQTCGYKTLHVASGASISIIATKNFILNTGGTFDNQGTINGPGGVVFYVTANYNVNLGVINAPIRFNAPSFTSSSYTASLSANAVMGSTLGVDSSHASRTATLDVNDKDISCTGVSVTVRAVMMGGTGTITDSGNWDTSAGTWTPESSKLIFTGTSATVKTAAAQTFYDLTVAAGASVTLQSDVVVTHAFHLNGTINKNGHNLTVPAGYENQITSTPTYNVAQDAAYSYTPTANQVGTFNATSSASWLTWDGSKLVGTPNAGDVGSVNVDVSFTNGVSTVHQLYTMNVTNVAPVFTVDPIDSWSYGNTYLFDAQTNEEGLGVTYSFTTSSTSMDFWIEPDSGVLRAHITDVNDTQISIIANDGHGGIAYQNYTLHVTSAPWDHEITILYTEGLNYRVSFDFAMNDSAKGSIDRIQWNFGDGNGSRDMTPVHTYDQPGKYLITCWVRLTDGTASAKSMEISVGDPQTVANIDNAVMEKLTQALYMVALVVVAGAVLMFAYARYSGLRGRFNQMVLYLIAVGIVAISIIIVGGALI
ncbi:MAG: polysaccharide deacetylase family protein [Methanomassiliicoccus sp.]|nr:polysaccharide deacetylase family protein [Methanomassiliicoccus sp.]